MMTTIDKLVYLIEQKVITIEQVSPKYREEVENILKGLTK